MDPEEETREGPSDPDEGTQEAPPDPGQETWKAPSDPEEETRETPLDPEETREAPSGPEEETKDAARPTDLGGQVVPALRKLTICGNLPTIMLSRTRSRRVHKGVEEAASLSYLPTAKEGGEEGGEESTSVCDGGESMALQVKVDLQQRLIARDMPPEPNNRKQVMDSPERKEWREEEEVEIHGMVENCVYKQVARPKDKLVVGTKMLTSKRLDRTARSRSTNADLSRKGSGRPKRRTTRRGCVWQRQRLRTESSATLI